MPETFEEREIELFLETKGIGMLWFKTIILILIIFLASLQFLYIYAIVSVIILFIGYFQMPTAYYPDQPLRGAQAWLRLVLGILIAFILWAILTQNVQLIIDIFSPSGFIIFLGSAGLMLWIPLLQTISSPAFSIFLLTIAFFCTLPKKKESRGEKITIVSNVNVSEKKRSGTQSFFGGIAGSEQLVETGSNVIFIILTIAAGLPIVLNWIKGGAFQMIFIMIWMLSLIIGWFGGREGRPYIGTLMMVVSLIALSISFPEIPGQAIFGPFWGTIYGYGTRISEQISPAWGATTQQLGDIRLMVTCPSCYVAEMERRQRAASAVITTGGTRKAIEITKFDIFSSILSPREPLIGNIELENQGEFEGTDVTLTLGAYWVNPEDASEAKVGTIRKMICAGTETTNSFCSWTESFPGDIKPVSFIYENDKNDCTESNMGDSWKKVGMTCKCSTMDQQECPFGEECYEVCDLCTACDTSCCYKHGGDVVKFVVGIDFYYDVNVTIPIEVIDEPLYETLLKNKEIKLKEETSEYSGGPVKATLWTQKQPLRNEEQSLVMASIYNEGSGILNKVKRFDIYVHDNLSPKNIEASGFKGCRQGTSFTDIPEGTWKDYKVISCGSDNAVTITQGNFISASFLIYPWIQNFAQKRKTFSIVGIATYEYSRNETKPLTIAKFVTQ